MNRVTRPLSTVSHKLPISANSNRLKRCQMKTGITSARGNRAGGGHGPSTLQNDTDLLTSADEPELQRSALLCEH